MKSIVAHLRLMRPANIITAIADILAGFAVSGAGMELFSVENEEFLYLINSLLWLILATVGLYGGGVVFNDVFDAELDKKERPERPIPSGHASVTSATTLAIFLLVTGIVAALQVSALSGIIAFSIAVLAILYDYWGKHQLVLGPIIMGLCRGGNLLLGISIISVVLQDIWFICFLPVIYIAAITMISRGEVHGGNRKALVGGAGMYVVVLAAITALAILSEIGWWQVMPFVLLFSFLIFKPLLKAIKKEEPHFIGKAVKAGVLSLIVLNASLAAVFAGWLYGLVVLLLLPFSLLIAKRFSVT